MHPVLRSPIWQAPIPRFDQLHDVIAADVCVVGLGGAGLRCIEEFVGRNKDVVGIDAYTVGGAAAGRNGGFLLAGLAIPFDEAIANIGSDRASAIYEATQHELDMLKREYAACLWETGSTRLALDPVEGDVVAAETHALRTAGFEVEPFANGQQSGHMVPWDAGFNPLLRCAMAAERAERWGARLFEHSPALSIEPGCVQTPEGEIRAEIIVVAIDGKMDVVLPTLAPQLRNVRLQMLATEPVGGRIVERPTYARYNKDYWQQLPTGEIAVGGCRDLHEADEDTTVSETSDAVQADIEAILRTVVGSDALVTNRWAGIVTITTDHLPLCEEVQPGVFAIGGYSTLGNLMSGVCAKAVAEHATGHDALFSLITSDRTAQNAAV